MSNLLSILGSTILATSSTAYSRTNNSYEPAYTQLTLAQTIPSCPVRLGAEGPGTETTERKCPIDPKYIRPIIGCTIAIGSGVVGALCLYQIRKWIKKADEANL
jgi:hypothetical protein